MSSFACPIVEVKGFGKHPNADALSITEIMGSTCIFKTGTFQKGDWAVFVPAESVVPLSHPAFSWLADPNRPKKTTHRVKAKKLRGVFSDGFLVPISDVPGHSFITYPDGGRCVVFSLNDDCDMGSLSLGYDMADRLGVVKYEEPEPVHMNTGNRRDPGFMPVYDMESWRKFKYIMEDGEDVVITEKLHGCNFRAVYRDGEVFVGSRTTIKIEHETNLWWRAARLIGLQDKLKECEGIAIYGEVYGQVQDLRYGVKDIAFAAFDAYDTVKRQYLDYDDFAALCNRLDIPMAPVLYRGPYSPQALLSVVEPPEGQPGLKSTLADCLREGAVIKTTKHRWCQDVGRVQLKLVSEAYLLRKNGTELH